MRCAGIVKEANHEITHYGRVQEGCGSKFRGASNRNPGVPVDGQSGQHGHPSDQRDCHVERHAAVDSSHADSVTQTTAVTQRAWMQR